MKEQDENTEPDDKMISFPKVGGSDGNPPRLASAIDMHVPDYLDNLSYVEDVGETWDLVDGDVMGYSYRYMAKVLHGEIPDCSVPLTMEELHACGDEEKIGLLQEHFSQLAADLPTEIQDRVAVYSTAAYLYESYCDSVGNVNFNGDPLPLWDTFAADPEKEKQTRAWIEIGRIACGIKFSGYHRGYSLGKQSFMEVFGGHPTS